jgi:hypothetical protein
MLLSSILRSLFKNPEEQNTQANLHPDKTASEGKTPAEQTSGLKAIEREIAAAAGLLKPSGTIPTSGLQATPGQSLEELIRAVSKFEESEQSRVVDVFK